MISLYIVSSAAPRVTRASVRACQYGGASRCAVFIRLGILVLVAAFNKDMSLHQS